MLKQCPKCGGDLYLERGLRDDRNELCCLQCGKVLNREEAIALQARRRLKQVA
jgi:hypothetical protein